MTSATSAMRTLATSSSPPAPASTSMLSGAAQIRSASGVAHRFGGLAPRSSRLRGDIGYIAR